ncbi:MAG: hypothetical protein H7175_02970 [Burkholderiales bacterium]|nr:hypothetical protein [Anaerolineae bacterium]
MRRVYVLILLGLLSLGVLVGPVSAQSAGITVTCDNGQTINNGMEVTVIQMRSGFTYTATAIGINGFDPVLAVIDTTTGSGLCTDDEPTAASYTANLPTTGAIGGTSTTSQIRFNQNSSGDFADVSLVVGGFNNTVGEFLLVLEGMAVTEADGGGDPFSLRLTPGLVGSGVPLTVYMISIPDTLDSLFFLTDENLNAINDQQGNVMGCDDAGNTNLCYGQSTNLTGSSVMTRQGNLGGFQLDAMMTLPLQPYTTLNFFEEQFFNYLMTSADGSTGNYVVAFHAATSNNTVGGTTTDGGKGGTTVQPTAIPTTPPVAQNVPPSAQGVSVTCPNGQQITNGVEITISMRPGFTYTATALGINGFDPILAVRDQSGVGLCEDDDPNAITYTASLPTTGFVPSSALNSQVPFFHNFTDFAEIDIIVGGFNGSVGQFLLVLEGMAVTPADGSGAGAGDPFSVRVTPNMIASGIPLTTYMISTITTLDPFLQRVDSSNSVLTDNSGSPIQCDDAGNAALCWGSSSNLSGSYISQRTGRQLPGFQYDAMLTTPLNEFASLNFNSGEEFGVNYLMTSYQQGSTGEYLVAFHMGIANASGSAANA